MHSERLTDKVFWVGVKDPDLRVFDISVKTEYGTTYNSYLILGEKRALIDTVKRGFEDDFLTKIKEHLDPARIDYLVVNHTEPDHSGAIPALRKLNPDIKFLCSKTALPFLKNVINDDSADIRGVGTGDRLELGGATLEFLSAPYMHWPDTMFTYLVEDKILFPCDGYAAHFCPENGMFYQPGDEIVEHEAWYYYDCIMRPYSTHCRKGTLAAIDLDIAICAPSHGPINAGEPKRFIEKYLEWTDIRKPEGAVFVVIAYASTYGNTQTLADTIERVLISGGMQVRPVDVIATKASEKRDLFEAADAILFGSPTFMHDVVPPMWDALRLLPTIACARKKAGVFGSYGWSGEAVSVMQSYLGALKLKVYDPFLKVRLVPSETDLQEAESFASGFLKFVQE